ncbi:MAG: hypothetical protein ACP5RP_04125 [Candidatus Micrarchaeia archaeon]
MYKSNNIKPSKDKVELIRNMKELEEYANSPNGDLRYIASRDVRATPSILEMLSNDEYYIVRVGVAGNPKTPPHVLLKLSHDKTMEVQEKVAENINAPEEALDLLSSSPYIDVKMRVARNYKTPYKVLKKLIEESGEPEVMMAELRNDSITSDLLEKMLNLARAKSRENPLYKMVLFDIAKKRDIPEKLLCSLLSYEDKEIQDIAALRLKNY